MAPTDHRQLPLLTEHVPMPSTAATHVRVCPECRGPLAAPDGHYHTTRLLDERPAPFVHLICCECAVVRRHAYCRLYAEQHAHA